MRNYFTNFKTFFESSEEEDNLKETLARLPTSHRKLVKNFSIKLHGGNTLNNDDQHIGYMSKDKEEIAVAAPWNYGREFALLHEVGHRVYDTLPPQFKAKWDHLVKNTVHKFKDHSTEEFFCMMYAQAYSKHQLKEFNIPLLVQFIKSLG